MLVDTHVHLYLPAFDADRDAVLARARAAGVRRMLLPAIDRATTEAARALAAAEPGVHAMAGVHPCYVQNRAESDMAWLADAVQAPDVVAVGESGLDYYWSRDHVDAQHESLRAHARLAIEADRPLVLHNRDIRGSEECAQDLVRLLREVRAAHPEGARLRGVFHCFGGPAWLAGEALALGFHVGLGGTLTYKNGGVPEAVADVPLERIVLETDGPYLAPAPHRGTRNEPAYVRLVAERLAALRGMRAEDVAEATTATAEALFRLPPLPKTEAER